MIKDKVGDCEVGDWFHWEKLPVNQEEVTMYQRDIKDFDMDKNNMVNVLSPMEWTFKRCMMGGRLAWKCIKKERISSR